MQFGEGTDLFDVCGRVVIVTGASAGIGRTLATGLAGEGASIVFAALSPTEGEWDPQH